ncbi:MAG: glycosyltransferase family 2 protein [Oligoflexales bacterium]|nr:glycosyltransferase family 2 protein [Oligoflexales bacterium]
MYLDLSFTIITLNEEKNLRHCLASLPKGVEIIIVDSNSVDNTAKIAAEYKAKFLTRKFTDYSEQKNFALEKATRNWVFSIDADEELSKDLREALEEFIAKQENTNSSTSFYIARRLVFLGKVMRFGKTQDAPLRLIKRGAAKFKGQIHEALDVDNSMTKKFQKGHLLHYSYDSLNTYFEKFNIYTSKVALKHFSENKRPPSFCSLGFRLILEFKTRYFLRLGFLDGYHGFLYAVISSFYAFIKYAKLKELVEGASSFQNQKNP